MDEKALFLGFWLAEAKTNLTLDSSWRISLRIRMVLPVPTSPVTSKKPFFASIP